MPDITVAPSRIEGLGIFAARRFADREQIRQINVVREITLEQPLRPDLGERADHCDYPDGKIVLLGYPDRHVNHNCNPNAFVIYSGDASWFVARREIRTGDEVTIDYNINISGGSAWPCRCGAARCSGTVVGDFFLLPLALQVEYRPLLADWFVRRHGDRLSTLEHA